ncbi:hypothetical protein D9K79_01815 [Acinetobacter cumulans]|uniref:Uncharacterized protein n=1 Tax=Acinetobacter cumulans TaxID=2136182 RepID=A0A498D7P6_9GAMM|nr:MULTISPECIES: hypothetical protein [Acinetobacter]NWK73333.1 hypothetical protein [Acinetobacter sp. SwsAc6]QCO20933.1 hypothetical protein C9E88_005105 [Acinetobacter cumulans]RFS35293.1 hypothetical protein DYI81_02330 [Acinetobacter sp. SWAC5]RKG49899.1 hypothetical protein D7V68_04395 [Acinetobacter cumulans]RLL31192.1 hypothetical protein D9K80_15455 [Acinetobacter cumulans]
MHQNNLGTEAIRAFFTLQCCWLNSEEVYLEKGCTHCGSAATYLIYFTNVHIQKLMLQFIQQYQCHLSQRMDLLDLHHFATDYNQFLNTLENEINFYARTHHELPRTQAFEEIESIFERPYSRAC